MIALCYDTLSVGLLNVSPDKKKKQKSSTKYFSLIFIIPHHLASSPPARPRLLRTFPSSHPTSPSLLPVICVCIVFSFFLFFFSLFFFCRFNHATARCSQDGIIGENVCAAYFSQGLSLANYCLDGSQRFSPITCIFSPSHAWTPAKARLALSAPLVVSGKRRHPCPERSGTWWHMVARLQSSAWITWMGWWGGTPHVRHFFPKHLKKRKKKEK